MTPRHRRAFLGRTAAGFGLTALLGFFHYVAKGPNEVARKDEEAAKRYSGDQA